ncbi:MAG: hypothetical protein ABUT20_39980 [Bacteroidota bacterium]
MKARTLYPSLLALFTVIVSCSPPLSYKLQTKNALELYKKAVADTSKIKESLADFYGNELRYGKKKYGKKNRAFPAGYAIQRFSEKQLKGQIEKLNKVNAATRKEFERCFTHNDCKADSITLFTRRLIQPQSAYSHLSSPYKNETYVFYVFTDYDPQTGFGRYYQSDSYYPRDAFSFAPQDFCPELINDNCYNEIEFFTGVFYLTHSELTSEDVVCLLSPDNDFNDRKVFSVLPAGPGKFILTKSFENRLYNFYPIMDGNYSLQQQGRIAMSETSIKRVFQQECNRLAKLKGAEAEKTRFNLNSDYKDLNVPRDYFYPLKGKSNFAAEDGWVYFGELAEHKFIANETFYRTNKGWGYNFSKEIAVFKTLGYLKTKEKKYISPFDIIKMRSKIPGTLTEMHSAFEDAEIIGEARPNEKYRIVELDTVQCPGRIWIHIIRMH